MKLNYFPCGNIPNWPVHQVHCWWIIVFDTFICVISRWLSKIRTLLNHGWRPYWSHCEYSVAIFFYTYLLFLDNFASRNVIFGNITSIINNINGNKWLPIMVWWSGVTFQCRNLFFCETLLACMGFSFSIPEKTRVKSMLLAFFYYYDVRLYFAVIDWKSILPYQ